MNLLSKIQPSIAVSTRCSILLFCCCVFITSAIGIFRIIFYEPTGLILYFFAILLGIVLELMTFRKHYSWQVILDMVWICFSLITLWYLYKYIPSSYSIDGEYVEVSYVRIPMIGNPIIGISISTNVIVFFALVKTVSMVFNVLHYSIRNGLPTIKNIVNSFAFILITLFLVIGMLGLYPAKIQTILLDREKYIESMNILKMYQWVIQYNIIFTEYLLYLYVSIILWVIALIGAYTYKLVLRKFVLITLFLSCCIISFDILFTLLWLFPSGIEFDASELGYGYKYIISPPDLHNMFLPISFVIVGTCILVKHRKYILSSSHY